ncbi:MAG: peptide-methionine (R)-S-oxide reductase MsrB, partial [Candidatus Berkelbacteria bacterium]|nr:peptide-methionine (R)-S-oxide reductase MsrB [Candidatus Berkelbacteria bacterium]
MDKVGKRAERDWQKKLTPKQYEVMRLKGTEAPFTGEFVDHHEDGRYACAACGNVLFESNTKYDSHCGWPSFYDAKKGSVEFHQDSSHGMVRNEVTCRKCGGHLGHIFDDGP